MCEKKIRKVKKGSNVTRLREARRLERLQTISPPMSTSEESNSLPPTLTYRPIIDKVTQNRVILELAWKTVALMQKNKLIQQKIIALQKETSEYVASVMRNKQSEQNNEQKNPCGVAEGQVQMQSVMENKGTPMEIKPEV